MTKRDPTPTATKAARKAITISDEEILSRSTVTIPAGHWDDFLEWVNAPARVNEGLEKLFGAAENSKQL